MLVVSDFCANGRISDEKSAALWQEGKKWCPHCKKVRSSQAFGSNRAATNGVMSCCRKCRKEQKADRIARLTSAPDPTAERRFLEKVLKIRGRDACWIWRGALDEAGHGLFTIRAKQVLARRAAVELFRGERHDGETSWLKCGVPPCVNPDHVIFCTRRDLSLIYAKDNPFARNARKDSCIRGHAFTPSNTHHHYVVGDGAVGRTCIECHRARKPGTRIGPRTREEALSDRSIRLTQLVFDATKHLNRTVRDDVRGELMAVLLSRRAAPRGEKLAALVRRLCREEWALQPNPFGRSIDAPIDEDGGTLLDLLPDQSMLSDPEAIAMALEDSA